MPKTALLAAALTVLGLASGCVAVVPHVFRRQGLLMSFREAHLEATAAAAADR